MIAYEVDILELATGDIRRTPMWAGWTEHSPRIYRETMCDCNLYGYRERGYVGPRGWEWEGIPHEGVAYNFLKLHGCDHTMPPKRYQALTAYLDNGRVYDFERHEFDGH